MSRATATVVLERGVSEPQAKVAIVVPAPVGGHRCSPTGSSPTGSSASIGGGLQRRLVMLMLLLWKRTVLLVPAVVHGGVAVAIASVVRCHAKNTQFRASCSPIGACAGGGCFASATLKKDSRASGMGEHPLNICICLSIIDQRRGHRSFSK